MNIKNWFKSQEGPMDMEAEAAWRDGVGSAYARWVERQQK